LLTSSAAWASSSPNNISLGAGQCQGNSVLFVVTVTSTGSGGGSATLQPPTGLPTGVTFDHYSDAGALTFSNGTPTDSSVLVLAIGPTATAGSTGLTLHTSPAEASTTPGTITINAGPTINTQPQPQSVCVGSTATFSVSAAGSGLTYQWQKNSVDIAGATNSSYTTPATTAGDDGAQFRVIVKTPCSARTTSSAATLTAKSNWTITASAGAGGSISPSGAVSVACGGNQAFLITPSSCFSIASVTVDGSSVGAVSSYTFTNVQANHTISATFSANGPYTINASAGTGGSISPSGAVSVNCGASQAFSVTTNSCFTLADLKVDGVSQGALSSYTFTNVQANHTIAASFTANGPYTINASAGSGGSITPSGAVSASCGSNQPFAISPDACHDIANVTVDGGSVGAVSGYTFTNVQANHTISASFTLKQYAIVSSAGTGGSISPNGSTPVTCGANQAYTISANSCFAIQDVTVDGGSVGAVSTYTFTNVTAAHTITASFVALGPYTINASAGPGGSITPNGAVSVNCGANQSFAIAADPCYSIADVVVDGSSLGAVSGYTFSNVQTNHTIAASFSQNHTRSRRAPARAGPSRRAATSP
jgi:transcriptional regulator CtsR